MRSTHRITLAVALAVSAVAGTAAATQTVHLGADHAQAPTLSASQLAAQKAKLARADRSIDTALAAWPPALPEVPRFAPLGEPSVPPVVVTKVVPVASAAAATSAASGDPADEAPAAHRPAHATSAATGPAPSAPAPLRADDGEDEGHRAPGGEDGEDQDHAEDPGDQGSGHESPEPEHGGED